MAILFRRYLAVIGSDRNHLAVLAILPVALGLLLRAVPAPLWAHRPAAWLTDMALQLLLAAVFSALAWRRLVRRPDHS